MAPIRTTKHSPTARSAKDPRGIYAPPLDASAYSPTDLRTGPSTALKRKRVAGVEDEEPFAFSSHGGVKVSKKDKRSIRHQVLLHRVQGAGAGKVEKVLKRRRPGKKLKTDLSGLVEVLPNVETAVVVVDTGQGEDDGWEGIEDELDHSMVDGVEGLRTAKRRKRGTDDARNSVIKMQSLRTRRGAMARKAKMEDSEMERFRRNLANMVGNARGSETTGVEQDSVGNTTQAGIDTNQARRWSALRSFLSSTMERSELFAK